MADEQLPVPDTKTLVTIAISAGLSIAAAAAEIVAHVLPDVANALSGLLPAYLAPFAGLMPAIMAGIAGVLLRWSSKYHKRDVKEALYQEPPDMIRRAYKQ